MYIPVRFELTLGDKSLRRLILQAARDELNDIFKKSEGAITDRIRVMLLNAISSSKEFQSLKDDSVSSLKGELGVIDPEERIDRIMALWSQQFYFSAQKIKITGDEKLSGGFRIDMIDADYLEAGEIGQFISEYGHLVEWLRWLLLAGDSYVVANYMVMFGTEFEKSRTGLAIMRRSRQQSYRVNPYFSGDINDNLVTRAFGKIQGSLGKIIKEEVYRAI